MHFDTGYQDDGTLGLIWNGFTGAPTIDPTAAILGAAALRTTTSSDQVYASLGSKVIDLSGEFTVTFKYNPLVGNPGKTTFLACDRLSGHIFIILWEGGLQWYDGVYGSSDTRLTFNDLVFTTGVPCEVAFSRDASGTLRCAKDGVLSASTYSVAGHDYSLSVNHIIIGSSYSNNGNFGVMDELMIANKCLFTTNYTPHTVEYVQGAIVPFV